MGGVAARASLPRRRVFQRQVWHQSSFDFHCLLIPLVGRVPTSTEMHCISCRDGGSAVTFQLAPLSVPGTSSVRIERGHVTRAACGGSLSTCGLPIFAITPKKKFFFQNPVVPSHCPAAACVVKLFIQQPLQLPPPLLCTINHRERIYFLYWPYTNYRARPASLSSARPTLYGNVSPRLSRLL